MTFGRNIKQGCRLHISYVALPPNLTLLFCAPSPLHNCEKSEKLKWENKHVLTIWDSIQLTVISNIYCKILTPISDWGLGVGVEMIAALLIKCIHPLCTTPQQLGGGASLLSVHQNQCQTSRFKLSLQTSLRRREGSVLPSLESDKVKLYFKTSPFYKYEQERGKETETKTKWKWWLSGWRAHEGFKFSSC